jgi:amino acid transporter
VQSAVGVIFVFLGQAGTSVYGTYEILVSMGIITYFIPYLFVFASLIRLKREPAAPGVVRIPGGEIAAIALGALGFATTLVTIICAVIPAEDEPHKILAVLKIVGLTGILLTAGVLVFGWGKSRSAKNPA